MYNGGIFSCGQMKHESPILTDLAVGVVFPDVDRVNIVLLVIVACNESASRIIDRQGGIG